MDGWMDGWIGLDQVGCSSDSRIPNPPTLQPSAVSPAAAAPTAAGGLTGCKEEAEKEQEQEQEEEEEHALKLASLAPLDKEEEKGEGRLAALLAGARTAPGAACAALKGWLSAAYGGCCRVLAWAAAAYQTARAYAVDAAGAAASFLDCGPGFFDAGSL